MTQLNPSKLHVDFDESISKYDPVFPRAYTLTHSDRTGDLFLTIGAVHNYPQISGWYTRIMRDEVVANWQFDNEPSFHVHCHVSGGFLIGSARWRDSIFRQHLPMVLQAIRFGDRFLFESHPDLDQSTVWVHFHAVQDRFNCTENWRFFSEYRIGTKHLLNNYEKN
jgi:hypothetical protein